MAYSETTRLLRRVRNCLLDHAPQPGVTSEDMLPPEDYKVRSTEEQKMLWRFYDPKHTTIAPDGFVLQKRDNVTRGNTATLGVWFVHPDGEKIFDLRHIYSPISKVMTRKQWGIVIKPLIWRNVHWVWLPSIHRAFDDKSWQFHAVSGWGLYTERVYKMEDCIELNPGVKREWIGLSLLENIITCRSQETRA